MKAAFAKIVAFRHSSIVYATSFEEVTLKIVARVRSSRWIPFVLLVLAEATRWMVTEARPDAEPTLSSLAMGCGWAALVSVMLLRRRPAQISIRNSWLGLIAGALIFGGPAIGALLEARDLEGSALTLALALTPVAAGIAAAALGAGNLDGTAGRIWPGLAAVGGLLLILVEPSLRNVRTDIALILAPIMTGIGAALFCRRGGATRWRATTALLGGTLIFALALIAESLHTATRPTVSLLALSCDGIISLLGIYALQRIGATRWSSQFTLLPLLVALEGIAMVRPHITLRWVVGLGLLALASLYLLLPPSEDSESFIPR